MNYNKEITDWLNKKFQDITLEKKDGHTISDKSYAFDTMFFMSRFIEHFKFGNLFFKKDFVQYANEYTSYLFMLDKDGAQVPNYLTETLAVLCFTGVLKTITPYAKYEIIDEELLLFVSSSFENAYIFNYMLVYNIYRHYGWWDLYKRFCATDSIEEKEEIFKLLTEKMEESNPAFGTVNKAQTSNYPKFVTKQHIEILNYANNQNHCARTGAVNDRLATIEDMALNVKGSRAHYGFTKKNDYLYTFSKEYILATLKPYLAIEIPEINLKDIEYSPSLAEDIADSKLNQFDDRDRVKRKRKSQDPKYKQTATGRIRTMQGEFKEGLLKHTPHRCPICGFEYEQFLIGSHILPYAKCEDTYDAMNYNNGILMCPICDKLFEQANYITIDAKTGRVIYIPEIENEKDFKYIKDKTIDSDYVEGERRHYLKWHNDLFYQKHLSVQKNK